MRRLFVSMSLIASTASSGSHYLSTPQPPLVLPIVAYAGIQMFDTANIKTADEYLILRNLFSPLFDTADNGELQGVLAESSQWVGDTVQIRLRDGVRTLDGHPITAKDAAFSLKRLLVLGKNTHARLGDIFPNCRGITSPYQECADITAADQNVLILRPENEKIWLLDTLTSQDFAIIPSGSVDPKTLAIIDYRNTSGPYAVTQADSVSGFVAVANPGHPLIQSNPEHPREIFFKAFATADLGALPEKFIAKEFNYYPKYFIPSSAQIAKIMKDQGSTDVRVHETELNFTRVLRFTKRGLTELTEAQRFALGNRITAAYRKHFSDSGAQMIEATSFYSPSADGALSKSEIAAIDARRKAAGLGAASTGAAADAAHEGGAVSVLLIAGCFEGSKSSIKTAIEPSALGFELVEYIDVIANMRSDTKQVVEPHFYLTAMDADPKASLSGITNVVQSMYFHDDQSVIDGWLKNYAKEQSRETRLNMLREAHFNALNSAYLVPIYSTATALMVRKPWDPVDYPQRNIVDALWLLKRSY
jgi:Bacterial extracellular solute-binding proteins, family 5 Middle